jgi:hypothetical protein
MAVDDFLGELAFQLGFGFEVGEQAYCETVVGFHLIGLEHQTLACQAVFECVHGRTLLAFGRLRTCRFLGVGSVDFGSDFFTHLFAGLRVAAEIGDGDNTGG